MTPNEATEAREALDMLQGYLSAAAQYFDGEIQRNTIDALCCYLEMFIDRYDEKSRREGE